MSEHIKLEMKNEKSQKSLHKPQNNARKRDINFEITDNFKHDRVRFANSNVHTTAIVPTHNSYRNVNKNHTNQNIPTILTAVNDTKSDFSKQIKIKNNTKCKSNPDARHLDINEPTLNKAGSKTSLKSDHKIVIKDGDIKMPTLRNGELRADFLRSPTGSLSPAMSKNLHRVDSKSTLKSDTNSVTGASSSGSAHGIKSLESMTDEEIIEENLKELLESKNREERKANGRLISIIVTFLVIFIGFYNSWLKNAKNLAAILVPVLIMVSYGGWVVLLAKRDKQRQVLFDKHLEEVMERNKIELAQKAKILRKKKIEERRRKEEEAKRKEEEKVTKQQQQPLSHRPSFREKLFGSRTPATTQTTSNLLTIAVTAAAPSQIDVDSKKKHLERMNALVLPHPPVRTGSVP